MSLAAKMTGRAGMSREKSECLIQDAREQAVVKIATEIASETKEMANFIAHLRRSRQLTAGLLLRGLLCSNKNLFEFALCELPVQAGALADVHRLRTASNPVPATRENPANTGDVVIDLEAFEAALMAA